MKMAGARPAAAEFILDLDGFEGPIDLLLALAREQKVDIAKISILALAEQYLAYIQRAKDLRLEIAADYLVTAAWLAYLKSRLLLPSPPPDDEPSGEALAEALALRLRRLDAIRRAGGELMARPQLGSTRLARGAPEGLRVEREGRFRLALHELLDAYLAQCLREQDFRLVLTPAPVVRVEDALKRITELLGGPDWQSLWAFLPDDLADELRRRSAIAASFAASLELAKDGRIELRQASPFGPIWIRPRP
jgi:segregation and condensation protein A